MRRTTVTLVAIAFLTASLSAMSRQSMAEEKPKTKVPKVYSSPGELFDAFREALIKRDWRTAYFCWTPQAREDIVFEAYFACAEHAHKPKVAAVLKKYGPSESALEAEYNARYKKKHGIGIAKVEAERKLAAEKAAAAHKQSTTAKGPQNTVPNAGPESGPPVPPADGKLAREVIVSLIADKAGFVEAVSDIFEDRDKAPFGKLTDLTVKGDTATGRASETLYSIEKQPGKAEKNVADTIGVIFHFRKSKDGWLIDRKSVEDAGPPMIDEPPTK